MGMKVSGTPRRAGGGGGQKEGWGGAGWVEWRQINRGNERRGWERRAWRRNTDGAQISATALSKTSYSISSRRTQLHPFLSLSRLLLVGGKFPNFKAPIQLSALRMCPLKRSLVHRPSLPFKRRDEGSLPRWRIWLRNEVEFMRPWC